MNEALVGALYTLAGTVLLAIITLIGNVIVKRLRQRASEPEMWQRLDDLTRIIYGDAEAKDPGLLRRVANAEGQADLADKKARATGHIVRDLARQWPADAPRPKLNPDDLSQLDAAFLPATHPWRVKPVTGPVDVPGGDDGPAQITSA